MWACTERASTPARWAIAHRRRDVSSTQPDANSRAGSIPVCSTASIVSTSHGFVTTITIACGDALTSCGIIVRKMRALVSMSSRRVCPGRWAAPAVTTITCEWAVRSISDVPVTVPAPRNIAPCARSSASASTRARSMS